MKYSVVLCKNPECRDLMMVEPEQLGIKVFCSTICWNRAQRIENPITRCGLCRMEFTMRSGQTFCDDVCMRYRDIVNTDMVRTSENPSDWKWRQFHKRNYYGWVYVPKFSW